MGKKTFKSIEKEIYDALDYKTARNPDFKTALALLEGVKLNEDTSFAKNIKKNILNVALLAYKSAAAKTQRKEFIEIIKLLLPHTDINSNFIPKHKTDFSSTALISGLQTLDPEIIQLFLNSGKVKLVEESKTEGLHFSYVEMRKNPKKNNKMIGFTLLDLIIAIETTSDEKRHQGKVDTIKMILNSLEKKYPNDIKEIIKKPKDSEDPLTALFPTIAASGDKYYDFLELLAKYVDQYSLNLALCSAVDGVHERLSLSRKTIYFLLEKGAETDLTLNQYAPFLSEKLTLRDHVMENPNLRSIRDLFRKDKQTREASKGEGISNNNSARPSAIITEQTTPKTHAIHILCYSVINEKTPGELNNILNDNPEMLNSVDEHGATPLFWLVVNKDAYKKTPQLRLKMIETLLNKGADLKIKGEGQQTLIQHVIKLNDIEVFKLILNKYPDRLLDLLFDHGEKFDTYVLLVHKSSEILELVIERMKNKETTPKKIVPTEIIITNLIIFAHIHSQTKAFELLEKAFPGQMILDFNSEFGVAITLKTFNEDMIATAKKSLPEEKIFFTEGNNSTEPTMTVIGRVNFILNDFLTNKAGLNKEILWLLGEMHKQGIKLTFLDQMNLVIYIQDKIPQNSEYINKFKEYINHEFSPFDFQNLKGFKKKSNYNLSSFFNIQTPDKTFSGHSYLTNQGFTGEEIAKLKNSDQEESTDSETSSIFSNVRHTWFDGALSSDSKNVKIIGRNRYFCLDKRALEEQGVEELKSINPNFHSDTIKPITNVLLPATLSAGEREYPCSFTHELKSKEKTGVNTKKSTRVLIAPIKADKSSGATLFYACRYTEAFHEKNVLESLKTSLKNKKITIYPEQMENDPEQMENKKPKNLNMNNG